MRETTLPERISDIRPKLTLFSDPVFGSKNNEYVDMIEGLEPGQAVFDSRYFGGLSSTGIKANFVEDDSMMEGRRGGVHLSYAGQMTIRSREDYRMLRAVFVKPFVDARDCRNGDPVRDMVHEVSATNAIANLYSYPVTFKVLGIAKSYNGTPQLLTEFNLSVTSVRNIFRPKNRFYPPPTTDQIVKGLNIAMDQAGAWVGGLGAVHRDFHTGNVARSIEYLPWFNDNETALPLEKKGNKVLDTDKNRRDVLGDLSRFFSSTVNPMFTRRDIAQKVFRTIDNKEIMVALLRTYQQSLANKAAISGTILPERYYMSIGTFTGLALASVRNARQLFTA